MKLFPEAWNEYATKSGRVRTPASKRSMQSVVSQLQARHPNHRVDQLTAAQLTAFCLEPGLAPRTIRHRRTVLRSFFEWAEYAGIVKTSPASTLRYSVVPGKHDVRQSHWLDETSVVRVIQAVPDNQLGRRNRIILMLGFLMGLRLHEIALVRWSSFSPDFSVLNVKGKGQKMAQMGVPPQLQDALKAWRSEAPADAVAVLPRKREIFTAEWDARVDVMEWDKPLGRSGIRHAVTSAAERAGVPFSPHDMRRSFGGLLESKGVPVTDIQRAMRHSNVGTTSVYLDKNPAKAAAITGALTIGGL
jgi:integrase